VSARKPGKPSRGTTVAVRAGARRASATAVRAALPVRARGAVDTVAHEVYAVVRAIPRGKVATYGQVAELAGLPSGHRAVARAMRTCPARLPWQRVVGRKDARRAQISIQEREHAALQRRLLEREGVSFDDAGFIVLARSGWLPQ
jgi:methylated-DNA-protein-cysteine methyltransferase related protein